MKKSEYDAIIEVLENLLKEEKRGKQFYKDATKVVKPLPARKLMEQLFLAETEHVDVLLKEKEQAEMLKDSVVPDEISLPTTTFDFAEIAVFEDPNESNKIEIPIFELFKSGDMDKLFEKCSVEDVFSLAKRIERDNFKYLVDAAKKMVTRPAYDRLIKLAHEEKEHFLWLQRLEKFS